MTKHIAHIALILGLVLLGLAGLGFAAQPLSEEALDEITAQGHDNGPRESFPGQSRATVATHNSSHANLTIQSQSQTHLRGGTVNNAAGRNQIANGINVR